MEVAGAVRSSCVSEENGVAYERRYQRLVGALEANGIGCPDVDPERVTDCRSMRARVESSDRCSEDVCDSSNCLCRPIPNTNQTACSTCAQICSDDFGTTRCDSQ